MLQQQVDQHLRRAGQKRDAEQQVRFLLAQVVGDESAVDPLGSAEIQLAGELGGDQTQQVPEVLRRLQQPDGSSIGKLADGCRDRSTVLLRSGIKLLGKVAPVRVASPGALPAGRDCRNRETRSNEDSG